MFQQLGEKWEVRVSYDSLCRGGESQRDKQLDKETDQIYIYPLTFIHTCVRWDYLQVYLAFSFK